MRLIEFGTRAMILAALLSPTALAQSNGVYDLSWHTIDCGGAAVSHGAYMLTGTIAQPESASTLSAGSYQLNGGFWAGLTAASTPTPDSVFRDGFE